MRPYTVIFTHKDCYTPQHVEVWADNQSGAKQQVRKQLTHTNLLAVKIVAAIRKDNLQPQKSLPLVMA